MQNKPVILLILTALLGAGCFSSEKNLSIDQNQDCSNAEYVFACYLDKATSAKDPNLCKDAGDKRITCLNAYAEVMGREVACDEIKDVEFNLECRANQIQKPQTSDSLATSTESTVNPDYMGD